MFKRFAAVAALVVAGLLVVFTAFFATFAQAQTTLPVEFQANEFYELPQGTIPTRVLSGDFNKDGRPDVSYIIGGSNPSRFGVQYGQADGTLSTSISQTYGVNSLVDYFNADFNKDGADDLLFLGGNASNNYRVLLGQTGSGFISGTLGSITGFNIEGGVTGDFNNDTNPDFIVFGRSNASIRSYFLFSGSGTGTFTQSQITRYDYDQLKLTAADFDNDGNLDIVNKGLPGQGTRIMYGDGTGAFVSQVVTGSYAPSVKPVAGDLNRDGKTDFVSIQVNEQYSYLYTITVYLNQGNRQFAEDIISTEFIGDPPTNLLLTDLNKDNWLDVVLYARSFDTILYRSKVAVYLNKGNGTLDVPFFYYDAGLNPDSMVAADFTGDTIPDLMVGNNQFNLLTLLPGLPGGKLDAAYVQDSGYNTRNVHIADLNGDGKGEVLNIVNNGQVGSALLVFSGNPLEFLAGKPYYVSSFGSIRVADFNNDAKPDIASMSITGAVSILLNKGNFQFNSPVFYSTTVSGAVNFYTVLDGDFTGDGNIDLVAYGEGGYKLQLLVGDGTGIFTATDLYTTSGELRYELDRGDVDGDGRTDLIVATDFADYVTVFYAKSNNLFANPVTVPVYITSVTGVRVGDVNGDNKLDLVARSGNNNQSGGINIGILLNNGNGSFSPSQVFTLSRRTTSLTLADFNNDTKLDLTYSYPGGGLPHQPYISMRLGAGDGTFGAENKISYGQGSIWNTAGDVNGDGNLDIAVVQGNPVSMLGSLLNKNTTPHIANKLILEAPQTAVALVPFSVTLKALLPNDALASTYLGTVKLEGVPGLVKSYTFEAADAGKHTFYLKLTAGVYTLTATSAISPQMSVSRVITVLARSVGTNPAAGTGINIGSSPLGIPVSATLVVSNTGSTTVVINSATFSGTHASEFTITGATFPLTLNNPGDSRELNITCTPAAKGTRTATLQLTTDAPGQPTLTYEVSCNGQLLVVKSGDDGTGNEPGTLSYYLVSNRLGTGDVLHFGISGTLTITGTLPIVPAGVTLAGGSTCATPIVLDGSGVSGATAGLRLAGGVTLQNIVVSNFPGVQLTTTATGNRLECVRAVSR